MTTRLRSIPLVACVLMAMVADAHADAQLWVEGGVSVKPKKRIEIDQSPQIRFDENMSRFTAFLPELSVRYRIERWLRVGAGYRLEYERDNDGVFVIRHRVSGDVRVRTEVGDVRFDNRLMLMEQFRPDTRDPNRAIIRNRVDVSYRGSPTWIPFVSAEPFFLLGDFDEFNYQKLRLTMGMDHHHNNDQELEVFFRAELHADANDPTFYILGLGYHYEL